MRRKEKEEQFEWWVTCIPDKVEALQDFLPISMKSTLDFTTNSLDLLEQYLLENFSLEFLYQNKDIWDYLASYIGSTYRRNVPASIWYVELDNERDLFYGKPILRVEGKVDFHPHSNIAVLFDRKTGIFLSNIIKKHIKYLSELENE